MDRGGTKSYHLFNHLGTTLALASAAQALTDTYRWNAWGVQLASTGSTTNPFGYVGALGYYRQPDTQDYWVRVRVYRPKIARWLSRDPLWVGVIRNRVGPYVYAGNNAPVRVDASGLQDTECGFCKEEYDNCMGDAASDLGKCLLRALGVGGVVPVGGGCLAGCAIGAGATWWWAGVWSFAACAAGCKIGITVGIGVSLGRAYFKCYRPYLADKEKCRRALEDCPH